VKAELLDSLDQRTESVSETATKTFGIRKVELIQRPLIDQEGTSFFFQINNVPMFISGSCWIPADSFTPRLAAQNYRDWVALAREGNQAMIRVWGGGIYEADVFYNACDELGVLVWQDFMFACANYPAYPEMLESIQLEAEQNVKRLRHHPSIVIWAGNNEDYLYMALAGLQYDADDRDPQTWLKSNFPAGYIYEYLLPKICVELTPDVPYHPGSPFGGKIAIDPTIGDIHQWAVWHLDEAPYQYYKSLGGRFVSEFGMQGLPHPKTVDEFFINGRNDTERRVDSPIVSWNNKATGGMDKIKRYLDANLKYSTSSLNSFVYSSQLMQSEALATAYRVWRRDWRGLGREYCTGAPVWQLNDCWSTTSWSIADYHMRPKMAFWAVKRESGPFTAGLVRTKDGMLEGWAGNFSLMRKVVDVIARAWDVRTGTKLYDETVLASFVLESNQSTELPPAALGSLNYPLREHVVVALYLVEYQTTLARAVNFHEPLNEVPFKTPDRLGLKIKADLETKNTWVELETEVPVKGLFLDVEDSHKVKWSDNGVDMLPGEPIRLDVTGLGFGKEHRITVRYLGMEEGVVEDMVVDLSETESITKGIQVGTIASSTPHHQRLLRLNL
jgi:beta-mannosidase